jgi:preprotein translocase subunit SecY
MRLNTYYRILLTVLLVCLVAFTQFIEFIHKHEEPVHPSITGYTPPVAQCIAIAKKSSIQQQTSSFPATPHTHCFICLFLKQIVGIFLIAITIILFGLCWQSLHFNYVETIQKLCLPFGIRAPPQFA